MQQFCKFLFGLWLVMAAFQAFAVNIDGNPLFYYYIVQIFLIGCGILCVSQPFRAGLRRPVGLLVLFFALATAGAFLLPIVFEGIPAFIPRISIDEQMLGMSPIEFSISNVVQVVYLATNVIVVTFAAQGRYGDLSGAFRFGAWVAATVIALSFLAERMELGIWINVLADMLRNNEAGAVFDNLRIDDVRRISGTFSEPSYAGVFTSALAIYFITAYLETRRSANLVGAAVMVWCVFLTTSLLGFVGLMTGALLIVFRYMRQYFALMASVCVALILAYFIVGIDIIDRMYLNRSGDSSLNRLTSDYRSIEILTETYLVGAGLGSHRASSLLSTMLANTGVVGTCLYLTALVGLLAVRVPTEVAATAAPVRHFAMVAWLALLVGAAELSTPTFWTGLVALVSVAASGWHHHSLSRRARALD